MEKHVSLNRYQILTKSNTPMERENVEITVREYNDLMSTYLDSTCNQNKYVVIRDYISDHCKIIINVELYSIIIHYSICE